MTKFVAVNYSRRVLYRSGMTKNPHYKESMKLPTLILTLAMSLSLVGAEERNPLIPFWEGKEMNDESVLFIKKPGEKLASGSLLFTPSEILSVKDSSGKVTYEEGRDFILIPGMRKIQLPTGSRIISKTAQELRVPDKSQRHQLTHRDGNGEILFGATSEYHLMQTNVSYVHAEDDWSGIRPGFAKEQLGKTILAFKNKKPLKILLLGDSISTGCNASAWADTPPHQGPFQDLLVANLKAVYHSEITLENLSISGKDTAWGLSIIGEVINAKPDLVIIAFGMNDAVRRPAKDYQAKTQGMIDAVRKANPDTEFILIATMLGNKNWTRMKMELFPQYREALANITGEGVALADMTSIWEEMLKQKNYLDLTGNGVNHPNDFGHRIYAQVLSALLIPSAKD